MPSWGSPARELCVLQRHPNVQGQLGPDLVDVAVGGRSRGRVSASTLNLKFQSHKRQS